MINLKQFMEAIEYKISDGCEYLWKCFGDSVRVIESSSLERYYVSVTFDTVTQVVYSVEANDEDLALSYRLINPDYVDVYKGECEQRGVRFEIAYDDVVFIDLENDEEMLEKINAIINGREYDKRVSMELSLPDDCILELALEAHRRDITLNDLICDIIMKDLERTKNIEHFRDQSDDGKEISHF